MVHEAATDVVCTLLYRLDVEECAPGELLCLEMTVLAAILKLEPSYMAASAQVQHTALGHLVLYHLIPHPVGSQILDPSDSWSPVVRGSTG